MSRGGCQFKTKLVSANSVGQGSRARHRNRRWMRRRRSSHVHCGLCLNVLVCRTTRGIYCMMTRLTMPMGLTLTARGHRRHGDTDGTPSRILQRTAHLLTCGPRHCGTPPDGALNLDARPWRCRGAAGQRGSATGYAEGSKHSPWTQLEGSRGPPVTIFRVSGVGGLCTKTAMTITMSFASA